MHRRRVPAALALLAFLALVSGVAGGVVRAQGEERVLAVRAAAPEPYVLARDLATLLGAALREQDDLIVLRRDAVALTLFDGSDEALLADGEATEFALSAPVEVDGDGWWLPLDAGTPFGLRRLGPERVEAPSGAIWRLRTVRAEERDVDPRASLLRPAPGVVALELRDAAGADGDAERAVWVGDLALLTLLRPDLRLAIDEALRDAGTIRALLLVATSRRANAAFEGIRVEADGRTLVATGARHETLVGRPDAVGPDTPWIALVWLPPGTALERPLRIVWEGAGGEVTFRN